MIELHCVGFLVYMHCTEGKSRPALQDFCSVSEVIRPSHSDTPGTLRQIIRHNKKYRALCKPKEGKSAPVHSQSLQPAGRDTPVR